LANIGGRLWSAALSIIAVPIFVQVLGAEAFGLIGLFATLQALFAILDLGLSATVNREIAQNIALGKPDIESKNLLRTLEIPYWMLAVVLGLGVLLASGWIATHWVNVQQLSQGEVQLALAVMALSLAAQWPVSLYTGALLGMQAQVLQNAIFVVFATFRTLVALAVVVWISPTITAFVLVQAVANMGEVLVTMLVAWNLLGRRSGERAHFQTAVLRRIWRFALSVNMVGVLSMIGSSADRMVISKFLPLAQLGYYSIASTAAGALPLVGLSVATAAFPRFAAQSGIGDRTALRRDYHRATQAVACSTVGICLALVCFSTEILQVWTQSTEITQQATVALSLLALAYLVMAVLNPAYGLLVASGHVQVLLFANGISILIFVPAMIVLIPRWGIGAAAGIWLARNLMLWPIYAFSTYRIVEDHGIVKSLFRDVFVYLVVGALWIGGARLVAQSSFISLASLATLFTAEIGYGISVMLLSRVLHVFPWGVFPPIVAGSTSPSAR